jgi:hypothetical protein
MKGIIHFTLSEANGPKATKQAHQIPRFDEAAAPSKRRRQGLGSRWQKYLRTHKI